MRPYLLQYDRMVVSGREAVRFLNVGEIQTVQFQLARW